MRGILIDPEAREVREIETTGKLAELYALIGCEGVEGVPVEADYPAPDDVYVDEEGLCKPLRPFFMISGWARPVPGPGVVLGHDRRTGDTTPARISVEALRARVTWLSVDEVRGLARAAGW